MNSTTPHGSAEMPAQTPRRVMIVDDDVDLAESLQEVLENRGYSVALAANLADAEKTASMHRPQVALIDVNLGAENGLTLITSLASILPGLLCVVITARADIEISIDAMRRGAFDYLLKPLHPLETLSRLERCFEKIGLQNRVERAEASSQAKSSFLAMVSHELRTPLNAIIGFAEIMRDERFGPLGSQRYREYASDIERSGCHLLQLINNILDLSRAEAGKLEVYDEIFNLNDVAAECTRQMSPAVAQAGLTLHLSAPSAPVIFNGDAGKIRQIMFNLLSNAVKFTPTGGHIQFEVTETPDGAMSLTVRDTGVGMSPADIPNAMLPFTQLDSRLARRYEGTGLGLPLTASLVELHGGTLALDSELGRGTTAVASFPPERTIRAEADVRRVSSRAG